MPEISLFLTLSFLNSQSQLQLSIFQNLTRALDRKLFSTIILYRTSFRIKEQKMKSLRKAIRVLEALTNKENGAGVTELSQEMNLPKSAVHKILSTFKSTGFVDQNLESKKYRLGLRIFELGNIVQSQLELRKIAHPYLYNLSKATNETTYLVVLEKRKIVYVDCVESTARLRSHPVFGEMVPLHCTGVGKAIMAFLPEEEIEKIIREKRLERFTNNTIIDPEVLKRELEDVRKRKYAIDNMEHEEGIRCVGASIRNHMGEVFAAISVSGPAQRFDKKRDKKRIEKMSKLVIEATEAISERMGYREKRTNV